MVALPLDKWFRRSARQAKNTKTPQARGRRHLYLECLEERVVPTTHLIDFGGLQLR